MCSLHQAETESLFKEWTLSKLKQIWRKVVFSVCEALLLVQTTPRVWEPGTPGLLPAEMKSTRVQEGLEFNSSFRNQWYLRTDLWACSYDKGIGQIHYQLISQMASSLGDKGNVPTQIPIDTTGGQIHILWKWFDQLFKAVGAIWWPILLPILGGIICNQCGTQRQQLEVAKFASPLQSSD